MKKLLKKWPFLAMAVILLATLIVIPTSAALASPPTDPAIPTELKCYGGSGGGSWGTYVDIYFKEGVSTGPLAGWCADEYHTISVGYWYTDIVYDYFGYDYPHSSYPLPAFVAGINWNAIAWILNNDTGYSMKVIQEAFWCILYPPNDSDFRGMWADLGGSDPTAETAALALATEALTHSDFVPVIGKDIRPVICYSVDQYNGQVQVLFFEFGGGTPPPPLPEWPAGLLAGMGLAGLAAFIVIKRRTVKVTNVTNA
jgi:hypothetical protein